MRRHIILILLAFCLLPIKSWAADDDYLQVAGLIDLRTTFSDGEHDLDFLVRLARQRGFKTLFLNDHDRMAMEYGLPPWRHIIKIKIEKPSVNLSGSDKYLAAVREINKKYPDMVLIPGVESAPIYYWAGSPLKGGLTAHDWEKHLLVVGLESPGDYERLPNLHNGFSPALSKRVFLIAGIFLVVVILGLVIMRWRGLFRFVGILMAVFGLGSVINVLMSPGSPFDQYHGSQGADPYQVLIDYVNERGGFTFWNHLEARSGVGVKPPIRVDTRPHPEMLAKTTGYTGFAAIYGDHITVTEPGEVWDEVLLEYCVGKRSRPVWGISTADFHEEGHAGERLGEFPTVFWVKELNKAAILNALKNGKMYSLRGPFDKRMVLVEFSVSDRETGIKGMSGDEITLTGNPLIKILVGNVDDVPRNIRIRLIRGGEFVKEFEGTTPFSLDFVDENVRQAGMSYYRLDVKGEKGKIVSNPIFFRFADS